MLKRLGSNGILASVTRNSRGKISTQASPPNNAHPEQFPPRTIPTRTIPAHDNNSWHNFLNQKSWNCPGLEFSWRNCPSGNFLGKVVRVNCPGKIAWGGVVREPLPSHGNKIEIGTMTFILPANKIHYPVHPMLHEEDYISCFVNICNGPQSRNYLF